MRIYAGVVPVAPDGQIALQERDDRPDVVNPGMVTTFGGLAEGAESSLDAACRELHEELGLTAAPAELVEILVRDKVDHDGRGTRCVIYSLAVPGVTGLVVAEGTGALVGRPAVLLADPRLTPTCALAVRALLADPVPA